MNRLFREHREIALVLLAFVALGIIYGVTTPLFEAPDEQWHFAFVQHVATGRGLPVQSTGQLTHLARQEGSQPPLYYLLAAAATFWIDTSNYPDIVWENPHYGYNVPGIVNDNKNLFIHTSLESFPWHGSALAIHIARWLSLLMGALAVGFTYLLALELVPDRKLLAASVAAFVGFIPQFLFISNAVSNDSTIVAMSALSLWLMVRQTTDDHRPMREVILLGIVCGLAALAKVSGLGLFVLAALVMLWKMRQARFSYAAIFPFLLLIFSFLLVAGWWYLRNFILYGELTGTQMMTQIFGARETPLTLAQWFVQFNEVWETFWVGLGWGNIRAHPAVYPAIGVFLALSALGWLIAFRKSSFAVRRSPFVILLVWVAIMFAALVNWMQSTQAPHGRLFFPALPALAVLVVFGLAQLSKLNLVFNVGLVALAGLVPFTLLQPAYAYPPFLTAGDIPSTMHPVDITFDGKLKLMGYQVSASRVKPGESITLTLYWQALTQMDEDYSIGIRLLDVNQKVAGARDSYPGHGILPTRLWRAGQIIRDDYWLPTDADASPGVAEINVSLYQRETKHDLPARDPQGNTITPRIGRIKLVPPAYPIARPQIATPFLFGKQIALLGYDRSSDSSMQLTLYWQRTVPITRDYTVFVHVLDANGNIVAQKDQMPAMGNNPTSFWDDGEVVLDNYAFPVPAGTYSIRIGLYDAPNGERLPVTDTQGNELGDHINLGSFEFR